MTSSPVPPAPPIGDPPPLTAAVAPLSSLGMYRGRLLGPLVGRQREQSAIRHGLHSALSGLACTAIDGEPGIGKTRFLFGIEDIAGADGFIAVAVTADEEIRGPFLLARSIFASPAIEEAARGTPAEQSVPRAIAALNGREPGLESMPADQLLVRSFDLAAIALRDVAAARPLALIIDDLQWSDEDSLRLLRYVARTDAASRIYLAFALQDGEVAEVNEAATLVADLERLGLLQRLHLTRFSRAESAEFLEQAFGGGVDPSTKSTMHDQAEGVPFVLSEQVRAYREAGLVQRIDGTWTLARNAERLVPSGVRTLIQRRAARLPAATLELLAEAAALGRHFSLRDLRDVKELLGEPPPDPADLATLLGPAERAGLLEAHADGSAADYSFTHEGVRAYAAGTLEPPRRREIHGAVVDMLMAGGEPATASLSLLAGHALAAGRHELCSRVAVDAARAALEANAPEEVLRLVALASPVATTAAVRVQLLCLRDDALGMLRRPSQRLEGLSELSALAEASGDLHLESDVMLRRAAALRLSDDHDAATLLARRVRERSVEAGDQRSELAACIELGQDLLRTEIGDATSQAPSIGDFDGAEEAYKRGLELAEALHDESAEAAVCRELGVIGTCRLRAWFVAGVPSGQHVPIVRQLLEGVALRDIVAELPIAPIVSQSTVYYERALGIYERLGDRKGVMSTVIAIAAASWAPGIHLSGSVQHIEELRRLTARVKSFTRESERALADAQMLYGSHVYARIRGFPDAAISKGVEAYNAARAMSDRMLEFATAGGIALQHAELGSFDEAERWLTRAASVATTAPTPFRAYELELWRGLVHAEAGNVEGMRSRLGQAIAAADEQGRAAARCDALALFAAHAARLGAERGDATLLADAERAANEAEQLARSLPGHPPWLAIAMGARVRILSARGDSLGALSLGRTALAQLQAAMHEDFHFEALLPAADAIITHGPAEESGWVTDHLQLTAAMIAHRILDEDVRVRWFGSRIGRELRRLGGAEIRVLSAHPDSTQALDDAERELLRLVIEARSNAEIATALERTEPEVEQELARLFAKIGVSSRADATAIALTGSLL